MHTSGPSECQTAPPAWRPTLSRGHDAPEAAAKVKPSPVKQRSQRERKKRPKEESDEVSVSPDRGRTSRSCSASSLGRRTPQSEREDYSPHHARDRRGPAVGEDYPHRERRHWGANKGRKKRERNARRKEQGKGKPGRKGEGKGLHFQHNGPSKKACGGEPSSSKRQAAHCESGSRDCLSDGKVDRQPSAGHRFLGSWEAVSRARLVPRVDGDLLRRSRNLPERGARPVPASGAKRHFSSRSQRSGSKSGAAHGNSHLLHPLPTAPEPIRKTCYAALVTRRLGEEAWHTNLSVAGVGPLDDAARDENASLRQLKEQQGNEMEKEQALLDEGRGAGVKDGEKKRKERKEGRCKRSTSSEGHKADSKKGRKTKTLKVCFKGTGLDPKRSLRKLLKKAKCQREGAKHRHSSSESSSNSSRSRGSSSSRAFEGGELAERVARAAPGALTRETLRVMKDVIGKVFEAPPEQGRTLVPLYHRYFHLRLKEHLRGPAEREALTLCQAVDCLLQGEVPEAADLLTQRLKSVEASMLQGASPYVARRMELTGPSGPSLTSRKELELAGKRERQQLKIRNVATNPWPRAPWTDEKGKGGRKGWETKGSDGKGKEGKGPESHGADGKGKRGRQAEQTVPRGPQK